MSAILRESKPVLLLSASPHAKLPHSTGTKLRPCTRQENPTAPPNSITNTEQFNLIRP